MTHVDVGDGWLIFGLPPSEVAVHPGARSDAHELYLMCDDVAVFAAAMRERRVECGATEDHGWGLLTQIVLRGGGRLGVYQPRRVRPEPIPATASTKQPARRQTGGNGARQSKSRPSRRR